MKERSGFSEWIDFDYGYCSCDWVSQELSHRTSLIRQKITGVAQWHWFSANGAYQFYHFKLTSRKSVNKRFQREYMSRTVSPQLKILRRQERGHRFRDGRVYFKHCVTMWDFFNVLELEIIFILYWHYFYYIPLIVYWIFK